MLPIVHRELRVASRSAKLYSRRLWYGMAQAGIGCAALLISGGGFRRGNAEWFFTTLSHFALFLCLLEGIRKTSDAISSEKREGTLGFLFLSTLSGADVVLGKLSGALIRSLSVLLPFLPILAISLLVGGTTAGEFWRVALVLVSTLVTSSSVCLLVSVFSRERSIIAGMVALGTWCFVPRLAVVFRGTSAAALKLISPLEVLRAAGDAGYGRDSREYWLGIFILWGIAGLALVFGSILVPRVWQEGIIARSGPEAPKRSKRERALLEQNPVMWLSYDAKGQRWFQGAAILLFLAGVLPLAALWMQVGDSALWTILPGSAAGVLFLLIWLRAAVQTSTSMAEARQNGSLELLLSTPLSVEEVIRGYWLAAWKSVRVPAVCVLGLMIAAFAASTRSSIGQAIWTSKLTIELLFEAIVLAAVGFWMGLKCKTRAAAVVYTILVGGLLPWVACIFTILVQVVLLARALDQVKSILRRIRNGGAPWQPPTLHPRPMAHANVPPVIR